MKIDVFIENSGVVEGSNDSNLIKLLEEIRGQYGDQIELVIHKKPDELFHEHNITATPALVIEDLIKFVGVVPSKESLLYALQCTGLE
jgi:hypothetical protein